jgi:hypothetical protein
MGKCECIDALDDQSFAFTGLRLSAFALAFSAPAFSLPLSAAAAKIPQNVR